MSWMSGPCNREPGRGQPAARFEDDEIVEAIRGEITDRRIAKIEREWDILAREAVSLDQWLASQARERREGRQEGPNEGPHTEPDGRT